MGNENTIAKVLRGIGVGTIAVGILASLIVGCSVQSIAIVTVGIISSVISGMIFIGFSETINLLQQNADNQEKIIKQLKEKPATVIHNTEAISTEQSSNKSSPIKHLFRCEKCGEMIEEYPCCKCGFKRN